MRPGSCVRRVAPFFSPLLFFIAPELTAGAGLGPAVRATAPYLGVLIRDAKPGILITEVRPKSPAERAGLATGDVIHELGRYSFHTRQDSSRWAAQRMFFDAVLACPVNKAVRVVFTRGGEQQVTYVRLVERHDFGFLFDNVKEGRRIIHLSEGGLAASLGIRLGDVILEYGDKRPVDDGEIVPVTLQREGQKIIKEFFFPRQRATPGLSSAQDYVLTVFGEPESFCISFVAHRENSDKTVRGETWNYHTLGRSFLFADGELMGSEPLEPQDAEAVFPAHRPWDFNENTSIEDVLSLMPGKTFVRMVLAPELVEDGVMYCSEQLVLGFKDDALVFAESVPLVAGKEGSQ